MKYILGVDGGGSKTHILLCDIHGKKVDFIEWGPTNHESLENGIIALKEDLAAIKNTILNNNSIQMSDIEMAVFGLSGVDTKAQHKQISNILSDIGFSSFLLCNDAYLGIFAGTDKSYGVCSINGTGCTTVGIDNKGNSIQIGGIGYLTGDCGGGHWLGTEVVSCVYRYLYKSGKYTILKDMLFDKLNIRTKSHFLEKVIEYDETGQVPIKDLNKLVFTAADKDDEVALGLISRMSLDIGSSIVSAITELAFDESIESIPVILSGSVFTKERNAKLYNMLSDYINAHSNKKIKLSYNENKAVIGAINICMSVLNDNLKWSI